jgi:streptomycin 6-kinase
MTAHWADETRAAVAKWPGDAGLIREGLRLLAELPRSSSDEVLLTTDLHAGNVLRAQREPWLAIDPKPFVGERAYDLTQHLSNCKRRMLTALMSIRRFAFRRGRREASSLVDVRTRSAEPRDN